MKHTGKRWIALLVTAALLLTAAACSGVETEEKQTSDIEKVQLRGRDVPEEIPQELADLFGLSGEEDTDGDGISDKIELYALGSDPLVSDEGEDSDGDGLTNYDEIYLYGTSASEEDTDFDSLSDYEELFVYHTDPTAWDTDGDGIGDGQEVALGTNPLEATALSTVDQTLPVTEEGLLLDNPAQPAVTGRADAVLADSVTLRAATEEAVLHNRAIVGKAVSMAVEEGVDADLTLSFQTGGDNASLVIMENSGEGWQPLDTVHTEEGLSARASGSGTYCVMDLNVLLPMVGVDVNGYYEDISSGRPATRQVEIPALGQADVVFVVDTTGSMEKSIGEIGENLIDFETAFRTNCNIYTNFALVCYGDYLINPEDEAHAVQNNGFNWHTESASLHEALRGLTTDDGGDPKETALDAVEFARQLNYRPNAGKFIILVTDNGTKIENRYGVASLEEEAALLRESGITLAVVCPEQMQEEYYPLVSGTGGCFADLDQPVADILMELVNVIDSEVSENWILLDDYQCVALKEPLTAGGSCDTDGDGLTDAQEVGSPRQVALTDQVMQLLAAQGLSEEEIREYFATSDGVNIQVYSYTSDPTLPDTDFDGMPDSTDYAPRDNVITGKMVSGSLSDPTTINYVLDYRTFFGSNTAFSLDLCETSLLYSSYIYSGNGFSFDNTIKAYNGRDDLTSSTNVSKLLQVHGMEDVVNYKLAADGGYTDDDITEFDVAHHAVTYNGKTKEIIAIVVRGTNPTIEEWSSNFDLGNRSKASEYPDWRNTSNHKGFDVAANRVLDYVKGYVERTIPADSSTVYWVMGHSRGAGIADIISANLVMDNQVVFGYTFAAPNVTISSTAGNSRFKCIFNLLNEDDFVPCVPMANWGFTHYGVCATIDMTSAMQNEWHTVTGDNSYNDMSKSNLDGVIATLSAVTSGWGTCYTYTCTCHGDGTNDKIIQSNLSDGDLNAVSQRAKKHCIIWDYTTWLGNPKHKACQLPAYFMQAMADIISADGLGSQFSSMTSYKLADQYEGARNKLVWAAAIGGIVDAHYCESYYVLIQHLSGSDFK